MERLFPRKAQQAIIQLGSAFRGGQNFFDQFSSVSFAAVKVPSAQELQVSDNYCEQVVEIMRHTTGDPAHCLHLLRLYELAFNFLLPAVISKAEYHAYQFIALLYGPARECYRQEDVLAPGEDTLNALVGRTILYAIL